MNSKYTRVSKKIAWCLRGMLPFVALMAAQAATGIDDSMPISIPPEIIADWEAQDTAAGHSTKEQFYKDINDILKTLNPPYSQLVTNDSTKTSYYKACHYRRVGRMKPYSEIIRRLIYARHYDLSGTGAGYQSTDSAAAAEGYAAGGAILSLDFKNFYPAPTTLISDSIGCIKDPCVSMSGNRVAFAWDKDKTGFHIYEIVTSKPDSVRQLTFNPTGFQVSDFEPCYLPNGDIIFNSTRCISRVPSGPNVSTNLYVMNKDGKYLRRLAYDMANTFYPTIMSDAAILYSRWEFNDRNNSSCFGLFRMKPDGTRQIEFFGNQLTWPTAIIQAREIPSSSQKILAIISDKVGPYCGDLALIDPAIDRNKAAAVSLIAPRRLNPTGVNLTKGVPDSARHFQNPYPLDEQWFLISYRKNVATDKFKIYQMNASGKRELIAWDANRSVSQQQSVNPQSLYPQTIKIPSSDADYKKTAANIKLINAYYGMAMDSSIKVKDTVIKKIRVIALDYRVTPATGMGKTGTNENFAVTPVARWKGSWNAKRIVGEGKVEWDGSANFYVPSRTPLYFQLLDSLGCVIQTMRSWSTLQPGEKFECYGCHENKNESPVPTRPVALNPIELDSFYGMKNEYLSYAKHIQPILTAKCAPCHIGADSGGLILKDEKVWTGDLTDPFNKNAERIWCKSYLTLTDSAKGLVNYVDAYSPAEGLKPRTFGSGKSKLITRLQQGMHGATLTTAEMAKLCAWIDLGIPHSGKYTDDMKPELAAQYDALAKLRFDLDSLEKKNIDAFVSDSQYAKYSAIGDNKEKPLSSANAAMLHVRCTMLGHRLFIKAPSEGVFSIVDLRGRRIMTAIISREDFLGRPERSFFLNAPAGLYILKFQGTKASAETTIPIL
jgi:hypothetical protein